MKCEICDGTFEGKGFRIETDPKDATFERVVDYKKCNICGAGMVLFHPYMPIREDSEPINTCSNNL